MPRIRQIKPEFYLDDELAQCSRDARLLFPGLWILADRAGRLECRPAKIKAQRKGEMGCLMFLGSSRRVPLASGLLRF